MIRMLTLALALAASPAWATGPGFSIAGASTIDLPGPAEFSAAFGGPCAASGPARIDVTFSDPDGIAYAAVHLNSVQVRPAVSDQAETWLWIPSYARPARDYRWRYEDLEARRTSHTIPIAIDLVPGAGPIPTEIVTKDGTGAMTIRTFALIPAACR